MLGILGILGILRGAWGHAVYPVPTKKTERFYSPNLPKLLMSSVRILLGHSTCVSRKKLIMTTLAIASASLLPAAKASHCAAMLHDGCNPSLHVGWLPPTNTYLSPVGRSARQDRRTSSQHRTEQYRTAGRVLQVRADRNVLAYMTGGSNAARRAPAKRDRSV